MSATEQLDHIDRYFEKNWMDEDYPTDEIYAALQDAKRYKFLRSRNLETIHEGGVFAGLTPINIVLNGDDLDKAIDAELNNKEE